MEPDPGILPATAHGAHRAAEHRGRLLVRSAVVEQQIDHLAIFLRQARGRLVEGSPLVEVVRLVTRLVECSAGVVRWAMVGVMVAAHALGSKVLATQVDELATNLERGQVDEVAGIDEVGGVEGPVQPNHGILEHIIGLFPARDAGVAAKHPAGESEESVAGMVDQEVPGGAVAPAGLLDKRLEPGFSLGVGLRGGHIPAEYRLAEGGVPARSSRMVHAAAGRKSAISVFLAAAVPATAWNPAGSDPRATANLFPVSDDDARICDA